MKVEQNSRTLTNRMARSLFGTAFTLIISAGLFAATSLTGVHAQSSGGSIFGSAPAGRTVKVLSTSGMTRHTKVNGSGHYRLGALPVGTYEATLVENDQEVDMHSHINLTPGGSARVDFVCPDGSCADASGNKNH